MCPIKVSADGELGQLTPDELAQVVGYVKAHRRVDAPFEVAALGGGPEAVGPFEAAGATWLLDGDEGQPGWEARLLERIGWGPPR